MAATGEEDGRVAMMRAGAVVRALCVAAALVASGAAAAAGECAAGSDAERARCEQQRRVLQECAGRTGDALAACRATVLAPRGERPDCRRLPDGYARYKCDDENRRAGIEARCGELSGDAYDRCVREDATKPAPR